MDPSAKRNPRAAAGRFIRVWSAGAALVLIGSGLTGCCCMTFKYPGTSDAGSAPVATTAAPVATVEVSPAPPAGRR